MLTLKTTFIFPADAEGRLPGSQILIYIRSNEEGGEQDLYVRMKCQIPDPTDLETSECLKALRRLQDEINNEPPRPPRTAETDREEGYRVSDW